jgi:hypothetical protein
MPSFITQKLASIFVACTAMGLVLTDFHSAAAETANKIVVDQQSNVFSAKIANPLDAPVVRYVDCTTGMVTFSFPNAAASQDPIKNIGALGAPDNSFRRIEALRRECLRNGLRADF